MMKKITAIILAAGAAALDGQYANLARWGRNT
jgi:hypothetical protein